MKNIINGKTAGVSIKYVIYDVKMAKINMAKAKRGMASAAKLVTKKETNQA